MFDELRIMADQIGWPLAVCIFMLVLGDRMGILSIKVGGQPKNIDQRIDKLTTTVEELNIKIARIEAILEERAR